MGLWHGKSILCLVVKKTMTGLVSFVLFLVNFHASNSFSVLFILEGTSPFKADLYQNHQSSVMEQQALPVLAEKQRESIWLRLAYTYARRNANCNNDSNLSTATVWQIQKRVDNL